MPLSGPAVRQSSARLASSMAELASQDSIIRDSEEVIRAVEDLAMSSPDMRLLPYRNLRYILMQRGIIGPNRLRGKPGPPRDDEGLVVYRTHASRGADVAVSPPLSHEESRLLKQETMSTKTRNTLNTYRVTQECTPYAKEARTIKTRIQSIVNEIDNITLELGKLQDSSGKDKDYINMMRRLYATERFQKQEELMRHRHRLLKIREIIRDILKKYEKYEDEQSVANYMNGGTTYKRKRSLKYKRRSLKYKRV